MTDATQVLPRRWAADGWRVGRIASALFVFAPAPPGQGWGRCVGDVVPTADGQWLAFTYPHHGRTFRARHRDVAQALDAVCSWVAHRSRP